MRRVLEVSSDTGVNTLYQRLLSADSRLIEDIVADLPSVGLPG
jgi:hypothetical protein